MYRPRRRQLLRAVGTALSTTLAGCGQAPSGELPTTVPATASPEGPATAEPTEAPGAESPPEANPPGTVGLETVIDGLRAPVAIAFAPDADRRYVLEQSGLVLRHDADGLAAEPALDLRDAVDAGGEKGLLGIALHPDFAGNRRLFLRYSAPRRTGTPRSYSHTFVLAAFEATADGRRIRRDTERTVLEIPQPQRNHNAGDITFGPDGLLYVPVGDGGAGGDLGTGHVDDWYDAVGGGNGQDVTGNLLGSLLRIDVDAGDGRPYAIPDDNPLVGREGLDEHYAWGFRNPWRLSFDGADLYVADVGQRGYEEVDLVQKGGNYGWNVREGTHCYGASGCPDRTPPSVRGGEPLLDPIIEYPRSGAPVSGISVIGGSVYRGSALPGLAGAYVFGDLQVDGRLFVATRPDDGSLWPTQTLALADAGTLDRLFSFGRDPDGEVYALGAGRGGGGVYRLVPAG